MSSFYGNNGGGGEGGSTEIEDSFVTRTLSGEYTNDRVASIGSSAFYCCSNLTSVSFQKAKSIGDWAFVNCYSLTTASFPEATSIGNAAFQYCSSLTTISFPEATTIYASAFQGCDSLTTISFPEVLSIGNFAFRNCSNLTLVSFQKAKSIGSYVFQNCTNLLSLYLLSSSRVSLASYAFLSTPIGGYTTSTGGVYGSVFVPESLLTTYKNATNWKLISSRIVGLTESEIEKLNA